MIWIKIFAFLLLFACVGAQLSNLDPAGTNVCKRQVTRQRQYYVHVVYQVVEYYETCCGFTWPVCWDDCVKGRLVSRTKQELRTKDETVTMAFCCDGWAQEGDNCPIPVCNDGCLHGTCTEPDTCVCDKGWSQNNCTQDINECAENNGDCEQICNNLDGSYECGCELGFTRSANQTTKCLDVDECAVVGLCSCANEEKNPSCTATCKNTHGSFQCLCSDGYDSKDYPRMCTNTNECLTSNGFCSHQCYDEPGSYTCGCPNGLRLANDSRTCVDIDECLIGNGGCDHICNNTVGSFQCSCKTGYTLDFNGLTCSDKDECKETDHGCEFCQNLQGTYTCACPNGFKLNSDQKTCSDINECTGQNNRCGQGCNNTIGSFQCFCYEGYELKDDRETCKDVNECEKSISKCDHVCINIIGSYICQCDQGFILDTDYTSCIGTPCESIPALPNGNTSCLTGRTGDSCKMECDQGFSLEGSEKRWCGIDQQWNGTIASCRRRVCPAFEPPLNSAVVLPCGNQYESKCSVDCIPGFYLNGSRERQCGITEDSYMQWQNDNAVCEKSTACQPNPCLHSGQCSHNYDQSNGFVCDCTEFYTGESCNIGILQRPPLPLLHKNEQSERIKFKAKPDEELIVTITSSSVNLTVIPNILRFTNSDNEQSVQLLGKDIGFFTLYYNLSGNSSIIFKQPPNDVVYVISRGGKSPRSPILPDGELEKGCITGNSLEETNTYSNFKWNADESSKGVIQIQTNDGQLVPLSISGGKFQNEVFESYQLSDATSDTDDDNCYETAPTDYLSQLINTNTFMYSIQQLFNKNSPYWIKFIAPLYISGFVTQDFMGSIFKGRELINKSSQCTSGFKIRNEHVYYLYQTQQSFVVYFPTTNITLTSAVKKCFVKDLSTNTIYVTLASQSATDVNKFSNAFTEHLNFNGTLNRFGFTQNETLLTVHSFGTGVLDLPAVNAHVNMEYKGGITWNHIESTKNDSFTFSFWHDVHNAELTITLNWLNDNEIMIDSKQTSMLLQLINQTNSCANSQFSVHAAEVNDLHVNKEIDNIVSFDRNKMVRVEGEFVTTYNTKTTNNDELQRIKGALNEHNEEEKLIKYLNELDSPFQEVNKSAVQLTEVIKNIREGSTKLSNEISTMQNRDIQEALATLRIDYLSALKRFHVLKEKHLEQDVFDWIGISGKFNEFESYIEKKVSALSYDIGNSLSHQIKSFKVLGDGMFCIKNQCYENAKISIISPNLHTTSSLCVQDESSNSNDTIIEAVLPEGYFGGMVKLDEGVLIRTNIHSNGLKSTTFKGQVKFLNSSYTTPINVNSYDVISTRFSVSVYNNTIDNNIDNLELYITSSLDGIGQDDPMLFNVKGGFSVYSDFSRRVYLDTKALLQFKQKRLETRRLLISANKARTRLIAEEMTDNYLNVNQKLTALNEKLNKVQQNLSIAQNDLISKRDAYLSAVDQFKTNLAVTELHTKLLKDCEPRLCATSCVPGVVIKACQQESFVRRFIRQCNSTTKQRLEFALRQENSTVKYTSFDVSKSCRTKCPPLTGLIRDIFGKRKRRGLIKGIAVATIAGVFKGLGGNEGGLGATIGGVLLGPFGAVLGGVIGSAFGSCNKVCNAVFTPITKHLSISDYEKYERKVNFTVAECETELQKIKVGYNETKACQEYSQCSNIKGDDTCLNRNMVCSNLRQNISKLITEPTYTAAYNSYAKASIYASLLNRQYLVLQKRMKNVQEEVEIAHGKSLVANQTRKLADDSLSEFEQLSAKEFALINAYKADNNLLTVREVSFDYNLFGGMNFPKRFLIDVSYKSPSGDVMITSLFIDLSNYEQSLADIVERVYQSGVASFSFSKTSRKRRALADQTIDGSKLEVKCEEIEKSAFNLIEFVTFLSTEISDYEKRVNEINTMSTSRDDVEQYNIGIRSQVEQVFNQTDSDVESILIDITTLTQQSNQEGLQIPSWNETLHNFFTQFELRVKAKGYDTCVSFEDCMGEDLLKIKSLLQNEPNIIARTVLERIPEWNDTINTLFYDKPNFDETKMLTEKLRISLTTTNPKYVFCGTPPAIINDLPTELKVERYSTPTLKISVNSSGNDVDIIWKRGNLIIPGENNAELKIEFPQHGNHLEKSVLYTCEVRNKFGVAYCNTVEVKIYSPPIFVEEPQDLTTYLRSPNTTYLKCNSSSDTSLTISWFFQSMTSNEIQKLTASDAVLDTELVSGVYWCEVSNDLFKITSRKALVNVLPITVGVERILVSFTAQRKDTPSRKRRENNNNPTTEISTSLTAQERTSLKSSLAKAMSVNSNHSILNLVYTKTSETSVDITFELLGKNFTNDVVATSADVPWENIADDMIADRETLFVRTILLYYTANKTDMIFNVNGAELILQPDSIDVTGMEMNCPQGQMIIENGYICGDCPINTKYDYETKTCVTCETDTYNLLPRQFECLECPESRSSDLEWMTSDMFCKVLLPTTKPLTKLSSTTTKQTMTSQAPVPKTDNNDDVKIIVPLVIAIVLIIVIAVIILVAYKRRNRKKMFESKADDGHENPTFTNDFNQDETENIPGATEKATSNGEAAYATAGDFKPTEDGSSGKAPYAKVKQQRRRPVNENPYEFGTDGHEPFAFENPAYNDSKKDRTVTLKSNSDGYDNLESVRKQHRKDIAGTHYENAFMPFKKRNNSEEQPEPSYDHIKIKTESEQGSIEPET